MPFQSEKQRRYLWANEPEIARDWTDTYGSRIESHTGGISRLGFSEVGSYGLEQYKKERSMIDQWMHDQKMQEDLLELERRKKVKEQKHMAAAGGRIGYAEGNDDKEGIVQLEMSIADRWEKIKELMQQMEDIKSGKTTAPDKKAHGGRIGYADGPITDDMGNIYKNTHYKDLTEEQFNERFGGMDYKVSEVTEDQEGGNALEKLMNLSPVKAAMGMFKGPELTQAQKDMNKQFFQTGNMGQPIGIGTQQNPFQMTSGPFTGMNAPGMSAFGSATSQEMAQKWLEKYKDTAPQTKVETMLDLASVPSGNPIGGVDHIAAGSGNNMGSANTGAYSSAGTTGAKEGYSYGLNRGGIVDLWRR